MVPFVQNPLPEEEEIVGDGYESQTTRNGQYPAEGKSSLVYPLEEDGIRVAGQDGSTALVPYRVPTTSNPTKVEHQKPNNITDPLGRYRYFSTGPDGSPPRVEVDKSAIGVPEPNGQRHESFEEKDEPFPYGDYGQLLFASLTARPNLVKAYIQSHDFNRIKEDVHGHQEIKIAIRDCIDRRDLQTLRMFDSVFDLDCPDDTSTIAMAARSGSPAIWDIFRTKERALSQKFTDINEHPLVCAFEAGNVPVAKSVLAWAEQKNVPSKVMDTAILRAATKGHSDVILLCPLSTPLCVNVITTLYHNGFAREIPKFRFIVNADGEPAHDFSYDQFNVLRGCRGSYTTLSHLIRHPSIQAKLHVLPPYYQCVNNVCAYHHKKMRDDILAHHRALVYQRAHQICAAGVEEEDSVHAANSVIGHLLNQRYADADVLHYVYK